MSLFGWTLSIKVAVTPFAVVLPALLASPSWLDGVVGTSSAPVLYRLYGVAILALIVGYAVALRSDLAGQDARWILPVGMVSNSGAALALLLSAKDITWVLAALFFGAVTVSFIFTALWPEAMTRTPYAKGVPQ